MARPDQNMFLLEIEDRDELYQSLAAGNSKKSEQGQEVVLMLENLISNADLITSGRMMGVKKGRLYNLFQLEEEMKRLSESLRNEKFQEEEGVEEDSDPGVEAETEMVEESKVEEATQLHEGHGIDPSPRTDAKRWEKI